jgi:hypothetical protein
MVSPLFSLDYGMASSRLQICGLLPYPLFPISNLTGERRGKSLCIIGDAFYTKDLLIFSFDPYYSILASLPLSLRLANLSFHLEIFRQNPIISNDSHITSICIYI